VNLLRCQKIFDERCRRRWFLPGNNASRAGGVGVGSEAAEASPLSPSAPR
jgi:hypothetical protein